VTPEKGCKATAYRHNTLRFAMQFFQLTTLLLLSRAHPVGTRQLQAPPVLTSRPMWNTNGSCTRCDLCLASVSAAALLPKPVQRILETAAGVAAGVCNEVPGPSGKECYDITSVIAHAFDLLLNGNNVTETCEVLGVCNRTDTTAANTRDTDLL